MEQPGAWDEIQGQLKVAKQRISILEGAIVDLVLKGHIKDSETIRYLKFIMKK